MFVKNSGKESVSSIFVYTSCERVGILFSEEMVFLCSRPCDDVVLFVELG